MVVLSVLVTALDALGLAMFFPLLTTVGGNDSFASSDSKEARYLVEAFENLGIPFVLNTILLVMVLLFIFKGLMKWTEGHYRLRMKQVFSTHLRLESIDLVQKMTFSHYSTIDSGTIQNTLNGEVIKVSIAFRHFFMAFQCVIMVGAFVSYALILNAQFAALVIIGGVLTNGFFRYLNKKAKKLSINLTKDNHEYQGKLLQIVQFFKYLKATDLIGKYSNEVKKNAVLIEKRQRSINEITNIVGAGREPLVMTIVVASLFFQITFIGDSIASLMISLLLFYRSLTYLVGAQTAWNYYVSSSGSIVNYEKFVEEMSGHLESENEDDKSNYKFENAINVKELSFSYGNKQVLNNISFSIAKNESIAFVGESGSGKSTLVNILAGLSLIKDGHVFIDDRDINQVSRHSYRKQVGYVTQEPVIFDDSLFNNITFWDEETPESLAKFHNVITLACLDKFYQELTDGHNSRLGGNGALISGGQKQRISLARELYKDVDLLVLDEATSALDTETEQMIKENIDKLKGKLTILMIAHRLSTVRDVDRIYHLNQGLIIENGTFDELKDKSEVFQKLLQQQAL